MRGSGCQTEEEEEGRGCAAPVSAEVVRLLCGTRCVCACAAYILQSDCKEVMFFSREPAADLDKVNRHRGDRKGALYSLTIGSFAV